MKKYGVLFSEANFYEGLKDFPVLKWWALNETEELSNICSKPGLIPLRAAYEKINKIRSDYIDSYGLSREATLFFQKTIQIELEENKAILNPGSEDYMLIEVLKRELKGLFPKRDDRANSDLKAIEKYMGVRVGSDLSIWEYEEYKKFIENDTKKYTSNSK